jgi:uncharacterized protein (TIGR02145 family)
MPALWSDSVWVFVDYNAGGAMKRLPVTGGAATAGTLTKVPNNDMGLRIVGNARTKNNFSATVKLYFNSTLAVNGACAYASNYPPTAEYTAAGMIKLEGTPGYNVVIAGADTYTDTRMSGDVFAIPSGFTLESFTDKTGAPGIIKCAPVTQAAYTLNVSASSFCVENGVTFALSGTEKEVSYRIYRDGTTPVGEVLTGTGNAATFTGMFNVAGAYTARSVTGKYCAATMNGSRQIMAYPVIAPGTITSDLAVIIIGAKPKVTVQNLTEASGGDGSLTYTWVRSGTGGLATLTGSAATYALNNDVANYSTLGTYYFNRYVKDATCAVTATGTYTLKVIPPGTNQNQGACTLTQPPLLTTFADFPGNYSASTFTTLQDERDNNNYTVVKMPDGRWWMAQNLNYQKDLTWQRSANSPSTVPGSDLALIGSFWCPNFLYQINSERINCEVFGALYSWETAMMYNGKGTWVEDADHYMHYSEFANSEHGKFNQCYDLSGGRGGSGICPPHWHVPTEFEWAVMLDAMESEGGTAHQVVSVNYLGVDAGLRAKAKCFCPNSNCADGPWVIGTTGTDAYGFRVLPAGGRHYKGENFENKGKDAFFWSSSTYDGSRAWQHHFSDNEDGVNSYSRPRSSGFSVRCIRDN